MQRYDVIDADAHVLEPGDLWSKYMEANMRERAPGLVVRPDGSEVFKVEEGNIIDINKASDVGMAAIGGMGMRDGVKPKGKSYYDAKPGGFDPKLRVPDMDGEGIDAAVLFPSLGLYLGGIKDTGLAAATARAYNRWLRDYCDQAPGRLFGVAIIPMQSVEAAVAEIKFARDELGFTAGYVRPNPYGNRVLHHPDNNPVWKTAEDLDFAISVHTTAANPGMPLLSEDRFSHYLLRHCTTHTLEMIAATTSFVMGGICDNHPKLRVGFMEAGGGWMLGYIDRMDRHFDDQGLNSTGLKTRPSEIFARQCFISFEPIERTLVRLYDLIGIDNILWASDYPHADSYTDAPGLIKKLGLPEDVRKRLMHAGAKRFYKLG